MLNYDDKVIIKIAKVKDEFGNFTHWESDVRFNEEYYGSGATGPTFYSVLDESIDYLIDRAQYWMSDDANAGK